MQTRDLDGRETRGISIFLCVLLLQWLAVACIIIGLSFHNLWSSMNIKYAGRIVAVAFALWAISLCLTTFLGREISATRKSILLFSSFVVGLVIFGLSM